MSQPKVSVVMGVYNGARYLREAVQSILDQTFKEFEFIIINDGSTDASARILKEFSDPRIKVIENTRNEGLTRSLIKGCGIARGEYIARMDADDVSYPERFQKQVEFLDANPEYAVVGAKCDLIDNEGKARAICGYYCSDEDVKKYLWLSSPFAHGSTMFVREDFERCGGYRELFRYAQDYDLWFRVLEKHKAANLPEKLYELRYHQKSITLRRLHLQSRFAEMAREFASMRASGGSDPIASGDLEAVRSRIESWRPKGLLDAMSIRCDSALQGLAFMVTWGKLTDVFRLWVTAFVNNPANVGVWKFLVSEPFRLRLRGLVKRLTGIGML